MTPEHGPRWVSSRAPVWGASPFGRFAGINFVFQVVPPCGGHQGHKEASERAAAFQVVPPCGGHLELLPVYPLQGGCFKSCPRVGGIRRNAVQLSQSVVSSRAPVWGASQAGGAGYCGCQRFKSCPRVGGIKPWENASGYPDPFQVVPPCGGHPRRSLAVRSAP